MVQKAFLGSNISAPVPNEIKQNLDKITNAIKQGNLRPVLPDYAKDIFLGLGLFNKILSRNDHVFFFLFCSSYLVFMK